MAPPRPSEPYRPSDEVAPGAAAGGVLTTSRHQRRSRLAGHSSGPGVNRTRVISPASVALEDLAVVAPARAARPTEPMPVLPRRRGARRRAPASTVPPRRRRRARRRGSPGRSTRRRARRAAPRPPPRASGPTARTIVHASPTSNAPIVRVVGGERRERQRRRRAARSQTYALSPRSFSRCAEAFHTSTPCIAARRRRPSPAAARSTTGGTGRRAAEPLDVVDPVVERRERLDHGVLVRVPVRGVAARRRSGTSSIPIARNSGHIGPATGSTISSAPGIEQQPSGASTFVIVQWSEIVRTSNPRSRYARRRPPAELAVGVQRMRVELRLEPLALDAERVRSGIPSGRSAEPSKRPSRPVNRALLRSPRDADGAPDVVGTARAGGARRAPAIAGRDAEQIARDRRHPGVRRTTSSPPASRRVALRDAMAAAGLDVPDPVRAQGAARPRFPAVPARRGAVRRDGRVLPGRGDVGARARLDARGDQLHRARTCPTATSPRSLPTGVHVNVDLLSQLERFGRAAPGTAVGIRVNPGIGASIPRRRRDEVRGEQADEVRHPARAARRRGGDRRRARADDRHGALPHRATST